VYIIINVQYRLDKYKVLLSSAHSIATTSERCIHIITVSSLQVQGVLRSLSYFLLLSCGMPCSCLVWQFELPEGLPDTGACLPLPTLRNICLKVSGPLSPPLTAVVALLVVVQNLRLSAVVLYRWACPWRPYGNRAPCNSCLSKSTCCDVTVLVFLWCADGRVAGGQGLLPCWRRRSPSPSRMCRT